MEYQECDVEVLVLHLFSLGNDDHGGEPIETQNWEGREGERRPQMKYLVSNC